MALGALEDKFWKKFCKIINAPYKVLNEELTPKTKIDLVTIGCPQASIEEIERTAELLKGKKIPNKRLWVFTSSENFAKAKEKGIVNTIEKAGGMVLRETCPEVVHYNHDDVKHILTNSMKAEHYLKSGLNAIDTSVSRLETCIKHAVNPDLLENIEKIKNHHKVYRRTWDHDRSIENSLKLGIKLYQALKI